MNINITINFDMDGTIADLYGVDNWLEKLRAEDASPYADAKPLIRLNTLARKLNNLQAKGYKIAIISWLSKNGSEAYNEAVIEAKMRWLTKHLPSVNWDRITIVPYGTPKQMYCETALDVLFDDEITNRINWLGQAYDVNEIMKTLRLF